MVIRRSTPEPPWGGPQITHRPGSGDELIRELAPLLAEDGIDPDVPSTIPDMETFQRALDRAVERRNVQLFTPVGEARARALATLRLFVEAISDGDAEVAEAVLATAVPESPDSSQATVAGTIGVALDLLDTILGGGHPDAPTGVSTRAKLPPGHWFGERAGRDILSVARRGRAFRALGSFMTKQGGPAVQAGAALALAGTVQAWADLEGKPVDQVTPSVFGSE